MKTNKVQEGDVLFRVDSQKLVIEKTNVREVKDGSGKVSINSFSQEERSISLNSFPIEIQSVLFFRTKDSAIEFIKTQIGI